MTDRKSGDMLEKIAAAIEEVESDAFHKSRPFRATDAARAALMAMEIPSEGMMDDMCAMGPDTNSGPFSYDDAHAVWRAGVNAILAEGGGE